MAIYIVIFSLFFGASMLEIGGLKKNQASWLFAVLVCVLVLFVGLRYNTGADWYFYKEIFNDSLSKNDNYYNVEYGYLLLNKSVRLVFDNYYVLQFFVTLFFVFSVSRFYKKEATYPITTLTLLICFMLFNILMAQMRQSLAISIIILFSNYIFERKLLHFLFVIFIASFFHVSAVTAIPLYFLYRNYGKILPIILILIANVFYFYPELLKIIVLQVAPVLPDTLSAKAIIYMGSIFSKKVGFNTGLSYIFQSIIILSLVLFVKIKDNKMAFFINSIAIFAIIRALLLSVSILGRLESYYLVYAVIAFTYIGNIKIKRIQLYHTKFIFLTLVILFFCVLSIRNLSSTKTSHLTNRPENYAWVPYYNCIFYPKDATLRKDWNQ